MVTLRLVKSFPEYRHAFPDEHPPTAAAGEALRVEAAIAATAASAIDIDLTFSMILHSLFSLDARSTQQQARYLDDPARQIDWNISLIKIGWVPPVNPVWLLWLFMHTERCRKVQTAAWFIRKMSQLRTAVQNLRPNGGNVTAPRPRGRRPLRRPTSEGPNQLLSL